MNKIKELRISKRISQVELANLANVSQPYLFDLENNRRGAKPETLMRIAKALGCTVDDLINKEDEPA